MRMLPLLAPSALALLLAAGALAAGVRAEVESGHQLAHAWCSGCHAVEPQETEGPYADVPSFVAVAQMPSTTPSSLRAFLTTPHGDMPDIKFTPAQLDEIISYILSLHGK